MTAILTNLWLNSADSLLFRMFSDFTYRRIFSQCHDHKLLHSKCNFQHFTFYFHCPSERYTLHNEDLVSQVGRHTEVVITDCLPIVLNQLWAIRTYNNGIVFRCPKCVSVDEMLRFWLCALVTLCGDEMHGNFTALCIARRSGFKTRCCAGTLRPEERFVWQRSAAKLCRPTTAWLHHTTRSLTKHTRTVARARKEGRTSLTATVLDEQ